MLGKFVVSEQANYVYYESSWDYHAVPVKTWSNYIGHLVKVSLATYSEQWDVF
jgi:hypothetical protein